MDYEQKYKAALEWMQGMYGGLHGKTKEEAEKYFTELKESEDKRIRNVIRGWIYTRPTSFFDNGISKEEMLAWLEKQSEQKPFDYENATIIQKDFAPKEVTFTQEVETGNGNIKALVTEKLDSTNKSTEDDVRRRSTIWILEYARGLDTYNQYGKADIDKNIAWLEKPSESDETKAKIFLINKGYPIDANGTFPTYEEIYNIIREGIEKQGEHNTFTVPQTPIKDAIEVTSRMQYISDDMKPIAEFIMGYTNWNLHKDEWNEPTLTVPLFRVLDALIQRGKPYGECSQNIEKQGQEKHLSEPIKDYQGSFTCWNNAHDFRPKHLQRCICYDKYMGGVYCYVYDDISKYWCTQTTEEHDSDGDNHISDYADYRITVWMPLPDTSFYPSKSLLEKQGEKEPAEWSEKDENMLKSIIATCELAEQDRDSSPAKHLLEMQTNWLKSLKQRIHVSSAKPCKNDSLLDLLKKIPSCITVDGIDYHFVMAKHSYYIAYYKGNREEGRDNAIFGITAFSPIDLLTAMLGELKEKGLLE